jgi:cytochrome c553
MRALAGLIVIATACSHAAPVPTAPRPAPVCDATDDNAPYVALCTLLQRHPAIDSLADLLPLLDDDLRGNFTLVYASRSPERDIDPRHPRVVLFGRDARLVLAFTGDPAGASRDVVQVMHYRAATRRFELEQFVLPAAARRSPALARAAETNGRPDPMACRRCHDADPRPIFDSYRVWPGVYGSRRDRLATGSAELASYQGFIAGLADPRSVYRSLRFPRGSPVSPYALDAAGTPADDFAPNLRFGIALSELARARTARRLEATPNYARYRDKLLAGLLGCEPLPIADADRTRVRSTIVAEDRAKLDRAGVTDASERGELRMAELLHANNVAELDFTARVLDTSLADATMALEPGALSQFDGLLSGDVEQRDFYFKEDLLYELLHALAATDAQLAPYVAPRDYELLGRHGSRLDLARALEACPLLAARARDVAWPALPAPPPAVALRCVRCHEPDGEGPPIPFASPARLRALLAAQPLLAAAITTRTSPRAAHAMPLDGPPLTEAERAQLTAYVRR